MTIYPAIDLIDQQAVRLYKGQKEKKKVYGNPVEIAKKYAQCFDYLHVIDLDGAFTGSLDSGERKNNLEVVRRIVSETGVRVQYGGGLRSLAGLRDAYRTGIHSAIIGTRALDSDFVQAVSSEFDNITVSLDHKGGKVAIDGWQASAGMSVAQAFESLKAYFNRFIFTDIEKDGTLSGISDMEKFWGDAVAILAGGVTTVDDVLRAEQQGFSGVVVGKALFEGKVTVEELAEINRRGD